QIRAEPPPLPGRGPYRVIVCDIPWPYEKRDEDPSQRAALPYLTSSLADICKLPVASIAAPDCILWFWVTNHHMREAFAVLDAWGFEQRTILTWVKDKMGYGDWLRGQTEHCLMCIRGKPIVTLTNQTTVLHAPVRGHSVKPVEFYDLVESLCPAPRYAYLSARSRHNDKWDCHGDEAPLPRARSSRDDIGPHSQGEIERLRARDEELEREKRRLEFQAADPGDMPPIPAFLLRAAS